MIVDIDHQFVASTEKWSVDEHGNVVIEQGNVIVRLAPRDVRKIALMDRNRPFDPALDPRGRDDVNMM